MELVNIVELNRLRQQRYINGYLAFRVSYLYYLFLFYKVKLIRFFNFIIFRLTPYQNFKKSDQLSKMI